MPSRLQTFRASLLEGRRLLGVFTRWHDPSVVATLAAAPLDFAVLDAEHGSLDRGDIDRIVFAARAADLPMLVRVPDDSTAALQHAITAGAAGIIVPHITAAEQAAAVAGFARTSAVERAYAGMGRLSQHRRRDWNEFQADARGSLVVIVQIDQPAGVAACEAIAATPGIDAVFMGTLSIGLAFGAEAPQALDAAMLRICDACRAAGRRAGMHLRDPQALAAWSPSGVSLLVIGNDASMLLEGIERAVSAFTAT